MTACFVLWAEHSLKTVDQSALYLVQFRFLKPFNPLREQVWILNVTECWMRESLAFQPLECLKILFSQMYYRSE